MEKVKSEHIDVERCRSYKDMLNPTVSDAVVTNTAYEENDVAGFPLEGIEGCSISTPCFPPAIQPFVCSYSQKKKQQTRSTPFSIIKRNRHRFLTEHLLGASCYPPLPRRMPSPRLRTPLCSLGKVGKATKNAISRMAVLPKRVTRTIWYESIHFEGDRASTQKCFAHRRLLMILARNATIEGKKGHRHIVHFQNNPKRHSTITNPKDGVDSETIFRQLNVLKKGGYWKHLPREEGYREGIQGAYEDESTINRQILSRKEDNKENFRRRNHPNANIPHSVEDEFPRHSSDEDDEFEEDLYNYASMTLIGFVFNNQLDGNSVGICVHEVTEEGWICSGLKNYNTYDNRYEDQNLASGRHRAHLLLRLPSKVAALGRQGMCIQGIGLTRRNNNGVLEPYNRCTIVNIGF